MQRLKGRSVLLGALAVLACTGDPTGNESTPTEIVASPEILFVTQGDSQPVIVSVIDEDGQVLQADFTITNAPASIVVTPDPTFQEVTTGDPIRRQARFFVKSVDLAAATFTVNALGLTKDVQVTAVPPSITTELSDTVPDPGETVTITAPDGLTFSDNSTVGVGIQTYVITTHDATSITFLPPPNLDGPVTVTNVKATYDPDLNLTLQTANSIRTVALTEVAGTFSNASPNLGQTITYTLPPDVRVLPGRIDSLRVAGVLVKPANITISADSGTLTFVPPPSSDSTLEIHGAVHRSLPEYPFTLPSTVSLTTPRVDDIAVTFAPTSSPALGDAITATAPAGFTFTVAADTSRSRISFGGITAVIQGVTANTITFVPLPVGTNTSAVTGLVTGITVTAAPQFRLDLPTATQVTIPGLVPLRFTEDPHFAPSLTVPAPGGSSTLFDGGAFAGDFFGFPARYYKLHLTATTTLTFTLDWYEGQDLGAYVTELDAETIVAVADDFGSGAGGHPETTTTSLDAGDYLVAIPNFSSTDPHLFKLVIDRAP